MNKNSILREELTVLIVSSIIVATFFYLVAHPHTIDGIIAKDVSSSSELIDALNSISPYVCINITDDFEITEKCIIPDGKYIKVYSNSKKVIFAGDNVETMFFVQGKLLIEDNILINGNNLNLNHRADTITLDKNGIFYLDGGSIYQSATNGIYGAEGSEIIIKSGNVYNNTASGIKSYGKVHISCDGKIYGNNDYGIKIFDYHDYIKIGNYHRPYNLERIIIEDNNSISNNLPDNIFIDMLK